MTRAQRSFVLVGSFLVAWVALAPPARADQAVATPVIRTRSGPHIIPYLGVSSFQGSTGKGLDPGFRFGGMGGAHINEMFSVNGEVTMDLLNYGGGGDAGGTELDLALSPFVHVPAGNIELVFGPKVGAWFGATKVKIGTGTTSVTTKDSVRGWLAGVNAGVFLPMSSSVALGGILSFALRGFTNSCVSTNVGDESCAMPLPDANKVMAFTLAMIF